MSGNSAASAAVTSGHFVLSRESIDTYLQKKQAEGIAPVTIGKYRTPLLNLLQWAGDPSELTLQSLQAWKQSLIDHGYGKITVQKHVTVVNGFLRSAGQGALCIPKPMQNDLVGRTFGYLTVLEPTRKRKRKDIVWRCACKCGKEAEIPTVMLLGGHTTSCGCLNAEILRHVNRYVEGTSLRQCMDDRTVSETAASGFVGVQARRGKWMAYINYKGVRYNLGTYSCLEDAVKARARGKEWIREEAGQLSEKYADQYGEMPRRPPPPEKRAAVPPAPAEAAAKRSDNTSGCTGVTLQKGKWNASICVAGYRYRLGAYEDLPAAVAARKQAEKLAAAGDLKTLKAICKNQSK